MPISLDVCIFDVIEPHVEYVWTTSSKVSMSYDTWFTLRDLFCPNPWELQFPFPPPPPPPPLDVTQTLDVTETLEDEEKAPVPNELTAATLK